MTGAIVNQKDTGMGGYLAFVRSRLAVLSKQVTCAAFLLDNDIYVTPQHPSVLILGGNPFLSWNIILEC